MIRLPEPIAFEWDDGNRDKSWDKHGVSSSEAEEVFFDPHKRQFPDPKHSQGERRGILVGKTRQGRLLFVVYTIRSKRIRIISARDLNKSREVDLYEKAP
ncbi:MAG: BrnT family toxin [Caldilineales bacterium]|nr:BrnT family toxin [Caldilineales bacterium]